MNFTDFLYDVFTLKSYETKSYAGRNREGEGGGKKEGREWELVESLNKTPATHRRKKKKKKAPRDGILSGARSRNCTRTSVEIGSGMEKNKWTRQTLSSLNQEYDEICHIIKGTRGPLLQREDGKTAQSSFNEIQGARAQHLNFIKCILCSFYWNLTV